MAGEIVAPKMVYKFGGGLAEGQKLGSQERMKAILGGKGYSLHEMTSRGLDVPPGFTIVTDAGKYWLKTGQLISGLHEQVRDGIKHVESVMNRKFEPNEGDDLLLVSVRSGAPVSMPGMMDTIMNLGLNEETVEILADMYGDSWFAYDCYRRGIQSYAAPVLGIEGKEFRSIINLVKKDEHLELKADTDSSLPVEAMKSQLIPAFLEMIKAHGHEIPRNPWKQLYNSIEAVFRSWNSEKAVAYRTVNHIDHDMATAVSVQSMVYGNLPNSGTGVVITGENHEISFKPAGQGEDVVSGSHSTLYAKDFEELMPEAYAEVVRISDKQQEIARDMVDLEFTVERGKVWVLQQRTAKRDAAKAFESAVYFVEKGLIDKKEAVMRIHPDQVLRLLAAQVDPKAEVQVVGKAAAASIGAAAGQLVFNSKDAIELAAAGGKPILARVETSTEDYPGMAPSVAVITQEGSEGCHAAIVCKSEGKPGLFSINGEIDEEKEQIVMADGTILRKGAWVTVDANNKKLINGETRLIEPEGLTPAAETLLGWADKIAKLKVRANADTPIQARIARSYGAKGVGLLRIEHWIQDNPELQKLFSDYILTTSQEKREGTLTAIRRLLKKDLKEFLSVMRDYPVVIRLLDPPMHEFLPTESAIYEELLEGKDTENNRELLRSVKAHAEGNPMLGLRGVRLGIVRPELTAMQAAAIYEAAAELVKEGINVIPEIMIPVVSLKSEIEHQKAIIMEEYKKVIGQFGLTNKKLKAIIGTMIELPSAALTADQLAEIVDFFSFGTNDLTQTTYGYSRDDLALLLQRYQEEGLIDRDPFQTLMPAVQSLMQTAIKLGIGANPQLEIGICGEHGRDPKSIKIAHEIGLDYVSPSRDGVPVARLVAAQAAIEEKRKK